MPGGLVFNVESILCAGTFKVESLGALAALAWAFPSVWYVRAHCLNVRAPFFCFFVCFFIFTDVLVSEGLVFVERVLAWTFRAAWYVRALFLMLEGLVSWTFPAA